MSKRPFHHHLHLSSRSSKSNSGASSRPHAVVDCVVIEDVGGIDRIFSLDRDSSGFDLCPDPVNDSVASGGRAIPMLSTIHSLSNLPSPADTSLSAISSIEQGKMGKDAAMPEIPAVQPSPTDTLSRAMEGSEKQETCPLLPCNDTTMHRSGTVKSHVASVGTLRTDLMIGIIVSPFVLLFLLLCFFSCAFSLSYSLPPHVLALLLLID